MIYKICQRDEWLGAEESGRYTGSVDDIRDGFIHFSTGDQLAGTLAKHFAGQPDLVLVALDEERLGPVLKWEPSKGGSARGGVLFPHLYDVLDISLIEWVRPLHNDDDGQHVLPDGIF